MINKQKILAGMKADLKSAETMRKDQDAKIQKWKDEHDGKPYGNEQKGKSAIVSRDIKKQSEWQHASIIDPFVSSPDIVKAMPVTFEDRAAAKQNEIVLNTQFCRQFNRFNFMTKAVKVLDREGTVVIKTGWEYEDTTEMVDRPVVINTPAGPIIMGTKQVEETIILVNKPTAVVCRNEDIYIDPTCQDDMEKCQFVIHRYETDYSTLKADGRYKNLNLAFRGNSDDRGDYNSEDETNFIFADKARKKVIVHEYWGNYDVDEDGSVESVVCAWIGDTIIRLETNPFPDKRPPFIIVPFNSVPFQMYGEANAELISDNQKVKTAVIRGTIDNMAQSNNGQKGIRKGALDIVNRRRFMTGKNFEFNGTPNDFWDGSYNQLPNSIFQVLEMQNGEIESITGVKSFSGGITGSALGSTATGARGALDATSTRRLNVVRNIAENLVKPLMRKWMAYNAEFLDDTEIMRITNEEFVEVKRDDLAGRIDIDIQVSTAEDNAAKAGELSFLLQTVGPNEDPQVRRFIMAEILRLQKMPDAAKKVEEYQPQPDPLAVQEAQLRIALLEAQVENERNKAQENAVDVQLKSAKTQTELAKSRNLDSKSDQQDLDFIEQETGVKRKRELEDKYIDAKSKQKAAK